MKFTKFASAGAREIIDARTIRTPGNNGRPLLGQLCELCTQTNNRSRSKQNKPNLHTSQK